MPDYIVGKKALPLQAFLERLKINLMSTQIDRTKELETRDIKSLLWTYALPAVISQIIASVYNIVDRIFIGQGVGALAIAGLAITFPIMNIIHAFGSLVGAGSSARLSIVLGRKDINWAEKIVGNSMILTLLLGCLFTTCGYLFMDDILQAFGATAETISYAREYMYIVLPGMFMTTVTFNLTGLIRASGYPIKAMWILAGGAILNIILDPIYFRARLGHCRCCLGHHHFHERGRHRFLGAFHRQKIIHPIPSTCLGTKALHLQKHYAYRHQSLLDELSFGRRGCLAQRATHPLRRRLGRGRLRHCQQLCQLLVPVYFGYLSGYATHCGI